ncbi:hypothetical protein [Pyxidicoccus sp. MSG2]|jgi:hypothetical protein|uniref:hypothetical protein n=1 Tax=Pyxidicoccus sp. MSG2 TaxID=2996790 RepID=UPI002270CC00|nr:hypothetical protein [Pyxidicoccus sp. MSG2]MCY1020150.1 hypothetical protein [Pyxidicoccus sp. MSG2]
MQTQNEQISFELKETQLKSIEESRQSSSGKLNIKTAVRAGLATGFDCIYFARNAPFAPEHL